VDLFHGLQALAREAPKPPAFETRLR
jgi:hypothetical protein